MDDVKSARRVFEFLEYFATTQRSVSVAELSHHFDYPNSSVSSIMRTMVSRGYLAYDNSKRTYLPTARLSFLVNWIGNSLFQEEKIRSIMDELSAATGETIILAAQNGLRVHYIHVIAATGPVRLHADPGSFREMTRTASGLLHLSRHDDTHVGKIVRRLNSDNPDRRINLRSLLTRLGEIRRSGYALSIGGQAPGGGSIAVFLPTDEGRAPLSMAIGSVEHVLRNQEETFVQLLKQTIRQHFGSKPRSRRKLEQ